MYTISLTSFRITSHCHIGYAYQITDKCHDLLFSDTSPPASAQFQSETLDEYYAENSAPVAVQAADSDNEMIVLKNPKRFSYYPRPQGNYGGYGGYRPNPPPLGYSYVGYINRQSRRYPVMMYTLVQCVPCQRAKHLLATTYGDVPSHFLEMVGKEDWQRQLQVDLLKVTGQATFPYVFVCGQFIGGSSDLFNMHHSGQLRQVLNNCMARGG
uniref:Glutaredoxin domain-containing protein n=1 Tax=Caenorhabditis japonica TaxID=281687 RepID=A0A8R1IFR7_CAEJA